MAYINFTLLSEKGISGEQYLILQCCKQMKFEDVSETLISFCKEDTEPLLSLEDIGLVSFVKGKAKDTLFQKARLTEKGTNLMDSFETPDITDEDLRLWDWLVVIYKKKDKKIGNATKGKKWLANFRVQSGISRNKLAELCNTFVRDESRMEWSYQLDYVFFKPKDVFTTRFSLEESKLWSYYQERKNYFDEKFLKIDEDERIKRGEEQ